MMESAAASRSGRSLDENAMARITGIARAAPLDAQPFMVAGAVAQLNGDLSRARELYNAARLRDPRAPAVRLLLADLELRSGQIDEGLSNLVAVVRVSPAMAAPVVPALAEFARTPGAVAKMRSALSHNRMLADAIMDQLATDPDNAALLFSLAPASGRLSSGLAPWQQRLIDSTVAAGHAGLARRYWARFNSVGPGAPGSIYNPGFRKLPASPPFNWSLGSGSAGIAELVPDGGLSIMHFGREPSSLARQLLTLGPGTYNIQSRFAGQPPSGRLQWRIQCLAGAPPTTVPASVDGANFRIGPDCPAAWLDLYAVPSDSGSRLDAVLQQVALRRIG